MAVVPESQTVKGAEVGGERGYDGGKRIRGRKRPIAVDAFGLLLAVQPMVTSDSNCPSTRDIEDNLAVLLPAEVARPG